MNKILFFIIVIQLLIVSWIDLKHKIISNYWLLVNLIIFLVQVFFLDFSLSINQFYFPLGFISIGFIFFIVKIMGAGDSKYLSSLFLLIPHHLHWVFFENLLSVTIVFGSINLAFKLVRNFNEFKAYILSRYWRALHDKIKSEFSFAPVILFSWIIFGWKTWLG